MQIVHFGPWIVWPDRELPARIWPERTVFLKTLGCGSWVYRLNHRRRHIRAQTAAATATARAAAGRGPRCHCSRIQIRMGSSEETGFQRELPSMATGATCGRESAFRAAWHASQYRMLAFQVSGIKPLHSAWTAATARRVSASHCQVHACQWHLVILLPLWKSNVL